MGGRHGVKLFACIFAASAMLGGPAAYGQTEPIRRFPPISFQRPTLPTFATSVADCVAYRDDWQQILNRIQAESTACSGANSMTAHATPIPSCIAYFPEVDNVGGCRTYAACKDISEQFWSTLHLVEEESKQCTQHVAFARMFEKRELGSEEQKQIDDLLSGFRSVVKFVKTYVSVRAKTDEIRSALAIGLAFGEFVKGYPASVATSTAQTVVQNAFTDYLDAMKKAADDAANEPQRQPKPPAASSVAKLESNDGPPPITYLPRSALRQGPDGLSAPVKVICSSSSRDDMVVVLMPRGTGKVTTEGTTTNVRWTFEWWNDEVTLVYPEGGFWPIAVAGGGMGNCH